MNCSCCLKTLKQLIIITYIKIMCLKENLEQKHGFCCSSHELNTINHRNSTLAVKAFSFSTCLAFSYFLKFCLFINLSVDVANREG